MEIFVHGNALPTVIMKGELNLTLRRKRLEKLTRRTESFMVMASLQVSSSMYKFTIML